MELRRSVDAICAEIFFWGWGGSAQEVGRCFLRLVPTPLNPLYILPPLPPEKRADTTKHPLLQNLYEDCARDTGKGTDFWDAGLFTADVVCPGYIKGPAEALETLETLEMLAQPTVTPIFVFLRSRRVVGRVF